LNKFHRHHGLLGDFFKEWAQETHMESNPSASLSNFKWFLVGGLFIGSQMFMNAIVLLVFSLIGLLIGSKLGKKRD
jgi:uncharacterized membrane protein YccF (DUF307 family)